MKHLACFLLLIFSSTTAAGAASIELEPEYHPKLFAERSRKINADESVYGVKFGSTEAVVLKAFGDPSGVIIINDSKKGFLYGHSHLLIFRKGRLRELVVKDHLLDWQLSQQMEDHPFFDSRAWTLEPGIRSRMTFSEVREALSAPQAPPDYTWIASGQASSTTFYFSSVHGQEGPEAYHLSGFWITHYGR